MVQYDSQFNGLVEESPYTPVCTKTKQNLLRLFPVRHTVWKELEFIFMLHSNDC